MVQVIDNRAKITGTVLPIASRPRLSGFHLITLQLEESEPVDAMLDLMAPLWGQAISLAVRSRLLGNARSGVRLSCLAKRTGDGAICVPGLTGDEELHLRQG